ncbi:MAG: hypothetical protein KC649_06700 [Candidatus Omnitrophica bacterium]|nr:hypothetical protein [Candidatus Omnitrophota bacterium]
MDPTEWIAFAVVAAAAGILIRIYFRKNKKNCCGKGCSALKPETKKPGKSA